MLKWACREHAAFQSDILSGMECWNGHVESMLHFSLKYWVEWNVEMGLLNACCISIWYTEWNGMLKWASLTHAAFQPDILSGMECWNGRLERMLHFSLINWVEWNAEMGLLNACCISAWNTEWNGMLKWASKTHAAFQSDILSGMECWNGPLERMLHFSLIYWVEWNGMLKWASWTHAAFQSDILSGMECWNGPL